MQLGIWTRVGPGNHVGPGVDPDRPMRQRNFRKNDIHGHARRHPAVSCANMAQPIEMPFGLWTWVGPSKHVLHVVRTGATGRIRLNRPCLAALQKRLN